MKEFINAATFEISSIWGSIPWFPFTLKPIVLTNNNIKRDFKLLWTMGCGNEVDVSTRVEVVNVWIVDVLKDVIFLLVVDVKGMRDVDL